MLQFCRSVIAKYGSEVRGPKGSLKRCSSLTFLKVEDSMTNEVSGFPAVFEVIDVKPEKHSSASRNFMHL